MLLRNIDPARGHCNGTRYIVRQISQRHITGQIACGEYSGNVLLIPRIPLSPTDAGLPFTLRRRQFPLRPAFAMTINKAQGQTLQCVGVLLDEPVFTSWTAVRRVVTLWRSVKHQILCTEWSNSQCCVHRSVVEEILTGMLLYIIDYIVQFVTIYGFYAEPQATIAWSAIVACRIYL